MRQSETTSQRIERTGSIEASRNSSMSSPTSSVSPLACIAIWEPSRQTISKTAARSANKCRAAVATFQWTTPSEADEAQRTYRPLSNKGPGLFIAPPVSPRPVINDEVNCPKVAHGVIIRDS